MIAPFTDQRVLPMETGFVARFEHKVLFRITRWVALSVCMLLFLSLVAGSLYTISTLSSATDEPDPVAIGEKTANKESAAETTAERSKDATATGSLSEDTSILTGMKLSPELQELFLQGDNRRVLEGWLSDIASDGRQDFLDNLARAASAAKAKDGDASDAVNRYHSAYVEYVDQRRTDDAKAAANRMQMLAALGTTLALVALFSLVLVLLAIERNTRNSAVQES